MYVFRVNTFVRDSSSLALEPKVSLALTCGGCLGISPMSTLFPVSVAKGFHNWSPPLKADFNLLEGSWSSICFFGFFLDTPLQ